MINVDGNRPIEKWHYIRIVLKIVNVSDLRDPVLLLRLILGRGCTQRQEVLNNDHLFRADVVS